MTAQPVDDPLDPHVSAAVLHEARSRLLRSARAAQRAWVVAFGTAAVMVAVAATLFAVSLFVGPGYILMWTVLLSAAIYHVARFWPQPPEPPGVPLDEQEVRRLRLGLDPHAPVWPDHVHLVPDPVVIVRGRRLTVGMPLLACLAPEDLRRLITVAERAATSAEEDSVVRRALTLAEADLGRNSPLWSRQGWVARGLTRRLHLSVQDFHEQHQHWLTAFRTNAEASSTRDALALHHRDLVVEGWQLMRAEWLDPAIERGCWHPEPFSSLREFLAGAQAVGALDALPARPARGPVADLVTTHETTVADVLLGDRLADDLRVISWSSHPETVTVPLWRSIVAEALDVARQQTGDAAPATVQSVLALVGSGDLVAVARQVAPNHGLDPDTDWVTMSRWVGGYPALLLTAAIGTAALDSGRFLPRWRWPEGTSLVDDQGWVLPLHPMASEALAVDELGPALHELGIDPTGTLWLTRDAGQSAPAERPTGAFVAYQGVGSRQVVVTDLALHVFGRRWWPGLRHRYALRMRGADELRTRMLRVWQGDETDRTHHLLGSEILEARFRLLAGGFRWRLVLRGDDSTVTLRGLGDGRAEEEKVAALLGERLTTSWVHAPADLLAVRNTIGRVGMLVGTVALVAALALTLLPAGGWPGPTAPLLSLGGALALVLAVLPDLVMDVVWRLRGHPERPAPQPVARRQAPAPRVPTLVSVDQLAEQSAMDAMTLDLGDLPDLPDWPDEIIDLDDLDDLPAQR